MAEVVEVVSTPRVVEKPGGPRGYLTKVEPEDKNFSFSYQFPNFAGHLQKIA